MDSFTIDNEDIARLKHTVLVVDDEPINICILERLLSGDYHVLTASGGAEAVAIAKGRLPDLILLDILMPGMDGLEACRIIKADNSLVNIPIIFVTALNEIGEESQGLELGAVDYISKPFNLNLLKLRVRNHLELKNRMDRINSQKAELEQTLARVKQLEGIIPICMYCKKIRGDNDYWQQIENYISEHTDALFSHGICPACLDKNYGNITTITHSKIDPQQ